MALMIVLSVGLDLRVLGFTLAISVVLVHPGIILTRVLDCITVVFSAKGASSPRKGPCPP
jgi:hypothetical protein